jgi:hypothetical protein
MRKHRALLVGWGGGVGGALLRLVATHPMRARITDRLDALVLPGRLDPAGLARQIDDHRITQVIEAADVDTLAFSRVCADRGADYVASAMQKLGEGDGTLTVPAIQKALPARRPDIGDASHLIGAGMNPGVVNALVFAGLEEFARRIGTQPDLYAIYFTEEDTTRRVGRDRDDRFEITWSPHGALEELLEPHAMYMVDGQPVRCDHAPHTRLYAARCGRDEVAAMIVPHEEVVTIGTRFPTVECAFFYAIPETAAAALRRHRRREPEQWRTRKLYPPYEAQLVGHDRVGVLLCSRSYGELWIGFDTQIAEGTPYGTNATLLQAAAGMLAGWALLGTRRGIHFVEDLDWRAYLDIVRAVLGPAQVHHEPHARVRTLADRRMRTRIAA